jgi:hypothetical protein
MQAPRSYTSVKVRKTLPAVACVWQSDSAMTEERAAARSGLFQGFSGSAQTTGAIDMPGLATQALLTYPMPLPYLPATARVAVAEIGGAVPHTADSLVRYRGGSIRRPTSISGSCGQASVFTTEKLKGLAAFVPSRGPSTTHPIVKMESQP